MIARLLLLAACAMSMSCVAQMEVMTRPDGSKYQYYAGQVGGAGMSNSSSGASQTFDGQKSFQDAVTGATLIAGSISSAKVGVAQESTKQTAAVEGTKQVGLKEATTQFESGQVTERLRIVTPMEVPAGGAP